MSIDSTLFRQVMRRFPTGVALLTVCDGDEIHGMTANSFTSVSLHPTLMLVCITKTNATHDLVLRTGSFALNILSYAQQDIARRFAHQAPQPLDPFAGIAYHPAATGAPILDNCIGYLDNRVIAMHDGGDHTIFIGEVQAAGFGSAHDAAPLLWLDGKYQSLDDTEPETILLPSHIA